MNYNYNELLSLTIPTYNRAEFLEECLDAHIPIAKKYNLQIIISDNASTDNTYEIVQKMITKYPQISYYRNEITIDADSNFQKALEYSTSNYTWLLGDSYRLPTKGIDFLIDKLSNKENDFDAIVFNLIASSHIKSKIYSDPDLLFSDLAALMTCISCLIFSKELIKKADFNKYKDSYFLQIGIIFNYIDKNEFKIQWIQDYSVESLNSKKKKDDTWTTRPIVFEIACKKWQEFIFGLSNTYTKESKLKVIHDFGVLSGIFTFRNLLNLRKINILKYDTYIKYKEYLKYSTTFPESVIKIIAIIPKPIIVILRFLIKLSAKLKQYKKYFNRIKNYARKIGNP